MKIYKFFYLSLSFLSLYIFYFFLYFSETYTKEIKRNYEFYKNLPPEKYEEELKIWYKKVSGKILDLDNPKTFNEKIQWIKLYDSIPIKTLLSDKYLVKDYIKKK
jgi:hypothetical protein